MPGLCEAHETRARNAQQAEAVPEKKQSVSILWTNPYSQPMLSWIHKATTKAVGRADSAKAKVNPDTRGTHRIARKEPFRRKYGQGPEREVAPSGFAMVQPVSNGEIKTICKVKERPSRHFV
jgi:hypothetical protein